MACSAETLVLGAEDDWAPYSASVQGQAQGFAVDVIREAYKTQGVEVQFVTLPFARCISEVTAGRLVGCFDKVRNSASEKLFLWPRKPLFNANSMIYALADYPETGLTTRTLEGQTVGVTNGYEYGEEFDGNARIQRDVAYQDESAFRKLLARRYTYMVSFDKVADAVVAKHREMAGKFKAVGIAAVAPLYLVFSAKHPQTAAALDKFNAGFELIEKNGTYKRLALKWQVL